MPERTVLLRIRADFDNDGIDDLALSESSTWGNAGGQWLLFRGQPDGSFVYWETLFFSPGSAALRPTAPGTGELVLYVRSSATRGAALTYRVTASAIEQVVQEELDLERAPDRARHERLLGSGRALPVEYCKLPEYRRPGDGCWRPGLGLR